MNVRHISASLLLLATCAIASANEHAAHDKHAAHRAAMQSTRYTATTEEYTTPNVELIDQLGTSVSLQTLLEREQPIALNFIFTTCTTICPVMTATFAQMRRELGEAGSDLYLISISIDPFISPLLVMV